MKAAIDSIFPWFRERLNQKPFPYDREQQMPARAARLAVKHRILIVDSEWNILKLLYSFLKPYYEPVVKDCPIEALKWIQEGNNPALIICEYGLPFFHAGSFIQFIKGSGLYSKTPVIILSGTDSFEQKVQNLPFKIDGFVSKPFDPTQLKTVIQKVLNEYEPRLHY